MSTEIELSVIIPTCNRLATLYESIESILRQREVATEIIVVDDSADGSAREVEQRYKDCRLTYIKRETPSGKRPALVRNQGAEMARGRYIYFLDDDDTSCPGALAHAIGALRADPGIAMVFGRVVPFGDDPVKLESIRQFFTLGAIRARKLKGRQMFAAYHAYCPSTFLCGAAVGKTEVFRQVHGFDASIPVAEDVELWVRMAYAGGFRFIDEPFVNYRTGASSIMNDLAREDPVWNTSYRIIQAKFTRQVGYVRALILKIAIRLMFRR